ncbi:MAG: hypothetical protein IMY71_05175 [Bacteroidetes bacterium]|nr:hypothetical protein [Bacteroidota bacterium]
MVDEKLYKDVFFELTVKDNKIVFYRKIKNLLSTAEKQELLEKHIYNKPFIVKILEDENRYSDIKQLVTDNIDSWDFNKLISPILEEYPDFCFETIKNKALKTITTQRGRVAYERIAEWINLAKIISCLTALKYGGFLFFTNIMSLTGHFLTYKGLKINL